MKLYDKIVEQLKSDIRSGKFKAGEKIPPEPELMKLYGVGRSTIREAIKTLAMSGILKVQQGSGTSVNTNLEGLNMEQKLRRADFDDINSVRSLLETEIVRLATTQASTKQIKDIAKALEHRKAAIQAENPQACADADIAFHLAIANAAGNPVLVDLYYHFTLIMRNFFQARENQGISQFAMNHHLHEQLFEDIQQKRPKQALLSLQKILNSNY
jgi:DNA-binding FadR family transcriptional regulator